MTLRYKNLNPPITGVPL